MAKPKILYYEADEHKKRAVSGILDGYAADFETESVGEPDKLSALLRTDNYSLILCSCSDGREAAHAVLAEAADYDPDFPVVLLTEREAESYHQIAAEVPEEFRSRVTGLIPAIRRELKAYTIIKENRETEGRYRKLFESSPYAKFVYSLADLSVLEVNSAAEKQYGYTFEEFLQKKITDLLDPGIRGKYEELFRSESFSIGREKHYRKIAHVKKSGEKMWADVYSSTVLFGRELRGMAIVYDATVRYRTEDMLLESNTMLSNIINSSPLAIVTLDRKGRVYDIWNKAAEHLFGWTADEVMGKAMPYTRPEEQPEYTKNLEKAFSGTHLTVFDVVRTTKDGREIYLHEKATPVREPDGSINKIIQLSEDVTSIKKAEMALQESEEKYRKLVETSHDLVWNLDETGRFTFINSASKLILGYSPDEIIGKAITEFINRDQADKLAGIIDGIKKGKRYSRIELVINKKDGRQAHISSNIYLINAYEGEIMAIGGTSTDITHIKKYQHKLEESLHEKEVLIKEIHHRVKNNLAVISGILALQGMGFDDEKVTRALEESQLRIKSIAMIHEMLYQKELFSRIEIKEYTKELSRQIYDVFRSSTKVGFSISGDEVYLSVVQAVPYGILANELITNALKHAFTGKKEGHIEIKFAKKNRDIVFSVSDNGVGLSEDYEQRVEQSLGMNLVEQVAEQLDGRITLRQPESGGTDFTLAFKSDIGQPD